MTRLMFAAAGVKYEDERIKWEDWPKLKTGRQRLYSGDSTECSIIFLSTDVLGKLKSVKYLLLPLDENDSCACFTFFKKIFLLY